MESSIGNGKENGSYYIDMALGLNIRGLSEGVTDIYRMEYADMYGCMRMRWM